jgi:hypothetical protein
MITSFSATNFRPFEVSGRLPIVPLTCLVGRNSSGKSSIIQALFLLRQSIEQRVLGARVPQLILNGPLLDAGSFEDIVYRHENEREMIFSLEMNIDFSFARSSKLAAGGLIELDIPRPPESRFWLPAIHSAQFLQQRRKMQARKVFVSFSFRQEPPFGPTLSRLEFEVENLGNATFVRTTAEQRVQHWRTYLEGIPRRSVELFFPRWSFFPSLSERPGRIRSLTQQQKRQINEFVAFAQLAILDIHSFLYGLRLLGPFRTPPARRYTFSGLGAVDTGINGERAVDLLITDRLLRPGREQLKTAVSYWLKKLGLARSVTVKDLTRKSNIFELAIGGAGTARWANFADVGFGVSQVLPVLVQGFLVPRGGTYVVQQPELHLHPDAQAGLADFFIYLASQGVQSIVETHSEYLLLRLRRRLAERLKTLKIGLQGEKDGYIQELDKNSVSVVYLDESSGGAKLVPLEIGDSFQFENLPQGFMTQSIDDRLALMKALRRK